MLAGDFLTMLIERNDLIPVLAIVLGIFAGIVAIVSSSIVTVMRSRAFEATRRELAAYVAEGSITPQDAVAILNSGKAKWEVASADDLYGKAQPT